MDVTRRPATGADRPFIWDTCRLAYRDVVTRQFGGWDDADQAARFEDKWRGAAFDVVMVDGVPAGAIWTTDEGSCFWLREIFLRPEFHGRGIGGGLVAGEIARARQAGRPLRLRVLRQNRARRLYERLGFTRCGETDTHFWMEVV